MSKVPTQITVTSVSTFGAEHILALLELSSSLYVRCITSDIPECQRRIQNSYLDDISPPSSLYVCCITSDILECQRRIQNSYLHHLQVACTSVVSRLTSSNVNVTYRTRTYIISK